MMLGPDVTPRVRAAPPVRAAPFAVGGSFLVDKHDVAPAAAPKLSEDQRVEAYQFAARTKNVSINRSRGGPSILSHDNFEAPPPVAAYRPQQPLSQHVGGAPHGSAYAQTRETAAANKHKAKGGGNPLTWGNDAPPPSPRGGRSNGGGNQRPSEMASIMNHQ